MRRTLHMEDGGHHQPRKAGSIKAGKDKETESTLEPPERKAALVTP